MKTLCLGGSFNPIHHGHLICARSVAETAGFARVLLIPSRMPPHKTGATDVAGAADRLQMCRLAIESAAKKSAVSFEVSDIEISRPGPSYTIDTARQMRKNGVEKIYWLIGADMMNLLPNWHQSAELLREIQFVIINRPTVAIHWDALPPQFIPLKNNLIDCADDRHQRNRHPPPVSTG